MKVALIRYTEDERGVEREWHIECEVTRDEVEVVYVAGGGEVLSLDEWVVEHKPSSASVDSIDVEAWETAGDLMMCHAEERAEQRRESREDR